MSGVRDVAIVGMAGLFPEADDIDIFWSNVLNKVDAITDSPDEWLGNGLIYRPDSNEVGNIYTRKGGFLGDLSRFDPREFGTMPLSLTGSQPDQFLALKLAKEALIDAGLQPGEFDGERVGVILGHAVHANRANTNGIQQYWFEPQLRELFGTLFPDISEERVNGAMAMLRKQLPRLSPDAIPGLIPNILTGRIANRLNLMGPNYIIDAACASSLISVDLAINELRAGNADVMLAGGVNSTTSPLVYGVFCSVDALSPTGTIRPFGREAAGTVLGEGAGIVVLKRLDDALAAGDRIYAVVKGTGQSSDGTSTGLMAPRREGAELAVRRAYESCGVDPGTVGLVEAHGTGIPLGERVELEALRNVFGGREGRLPTIPIGSVKSMIGHCIPAAGSASIIKTALALSNRIIPPTIVGEVNEATGLPDTPFYVAEEARPWIRRAAGPRRAGINAFGFGGINAHMILEESPEGRTPDPTAAFIAPSPALRAPDQIFVFTGAGPEEVVAELDAFEEPAAEVFAAAALATWDRSCVAPGPARLAIVADAPGDLSKKIANARRTLESRGAVPIQTRNGIYFEPAPLEGKVAFLFPGEMAQYTGMLREAAIAVPAIGEWLADISVLTEARREVSLTETVYPPDNLVDAETRRSIEGLMHQVDYGSEMVFAADQAIHETLNALGIRADAMLGHSTGENAAIVASGRLKLDRSGVCRLIARMNDVFDQITDSGAVPNGVLLTVAVLERERLEEILTDFPNLHFTMDNCPNQAVLFGDRQDIDAFEARVVTENAVCTRLPISWGYHTEYIRPMAEGFRGLFSDVQIVQSEVTLYSCCTAQPFPEEPEAALDTAVQQYVSRVRFREAIEQLYEDGHRIFVECGPNANLTAFVRDILGNRPHLAEAADNKRRGMLGQLRHLVARLFVAGLEPDVAALLSPPESADAVRRRAAREAHRQAPRLKSELASLTLDEAARNELRTLLVDRDGLDGNAPAPAASPCAAADMPVANGANGHAPVRRPPRHDGRGLAMQGHINLMGEFLQGQDRVLTSAMGGTRPGGNGRARIGVHDIGQVFDVPIPLRAYLMKGSPDSAAMQAYLSGGERDEAGRLSEDPRSADRWRAWSLSRLAVKRAAAEILAGDTGQRHGGQHFEIRKDANGAPYLAARGGWPMPSISLAHAATVGVGAACPSAWRVGIDFDVPDRIRNAGDFLTAILGPEEVRELKPRGDRITAAGLWSAKEAAAKALGIGLQGRPQAFRIRELERRSGAAVIEYEGRLVTAHIRRVGDGVCAVAYLDS